MAKIRVTRGGDAYDHIGKIPEWEIPLVGDPPRLGTFRMIPFPGDGHVPERRQTYLRQAAAMEAFEEGDWELVEEDESPGTAGPGAAS